MWGSSFITFYQRWLRPPRKTILKLASTAHAHFLFLATLFASMDSLLLFRGRPTCSGPWDTDQRIFAEFSWRQGWGVATHRFSTKDRSDRCGLQSISLALLRLSLFLIGRQIRFIKTAWCDRSTRGNDDLVIVTALSLSDSSLSTSLHHGLHMM